MGTYNISEFWDDRLDTAMRSIWGGQACCSAFPHHRATPHSVARTAQGARNAATETYQMDRRESEHRANAAMRPKNEFVGVLLCF